MSQDDGKRHPRKLLILSENPIDGIWTHLSAFESETLATNNPGTRKRVGERGVAEAESDSTRLLYTKCSREPPQYSGAEPDATYHRELLWLPLARERVDGC